MKLFIVTFEKRDPPEDMDYEDRWRVANFAAKDIQTVINNVTISSDEQISIREDGEITVLE